MLPASEIRARPAARAHAAAPRTGAARATCSRPAPTRSSTASACVAWDTYAEGRKRFPESLGLLKAAGRLAVDLAALRGSGAAAGSGAGARHHRPRSPVLPRARARRSGRGRQGARGLGGRAPLPRLPRPGAAQAGPGGRRAPATSSGPSTGVREAVQAAPDAVRAGALEVALLRRAGRTAEARAPAPRTGARVDPTSSLLRYEARAAGRARRRALGAPGRGSRSRAGPGRPSTWPPASTADALDLLDRRYPAVRRAADRAGRGRAPGPSGGRATTAATRARSRAASGAADYAAASKLSTRYVFPSRAAIAGRVPARPRGQPAGRDRALPAGHAPPRLRPRAGRRAGVAGGAAPGPDAGPSSIATSAARSCRSRATWKARWPSSWKGWAPTPRTWTSTRAPTRP